MQIFKNIGIDVDDNLKEVVKDAGPGDKILVANLPKDETIKQFIITNLGAYIITEKGSVYHNNTKIDLSICLYDNYSYFDVYDKAFVYINRHLVSINSKPAINLGENAKNLIVNKEGVRFKKDESYYFLKFSNEKIKKISAKKYHNEGNCEPLTCSQLQEKYKIPNEFVPFDFIQTPYGLITISKSPFDKVSFFDENGIRKSLDNEWVSRKTIGTREDGITIHKIEHGDRGDSYTECLFFLYDEILSGKEFYPRNLPENFSRGLSLKDIMFFDKRGKMQIGNQIDRRKENQLWFVMKDKDE
jgi:hypothetical protein